MAQLKTKPGVSTKEQQFLAKIADAVINRDVPAEISVMKASLKQTLKDDSCRSAILKSIGAEIYMFYGEKFKADGTFEKDKTRVVLRSNRRDPSKIGETHDHNFNPISVMTHLNLAAVEHSLIAAYDLKGAFLLTPMQEGKRMFIKISGDVVKY